MSSSALQGQLGEGVVANILQYLSLNQANGCLMLENAALNSKQLLGDNGTVGRIFFEQGRVVHIELGGTENIAALARMSAWREGRFYFHPDEPVKKHTMRMAVDKLLLQAAYEADTGDVGLHDLKPNTIVRNRDDGTQEQTLNISVKSLTVLRYVDGERTLANIAQVSGVDFEEIRLEILNLIQGNVVEALDATLDDKQLHNLWYHAYESLNEYATRKNLDALKLTWGRIANQLVDDYPSLDPFSPDVKFTSNGLERMSSRPMKPVLPALLAISVGIARYYGLNRRSLSEAMQLQDMDGLELRMSRLAELMPVKRAKDTLS